MLLLNSSCVIALQEDPLVLNEIREDLRTECEKFGQVKKVLIFDVGIFLHVVLAQCLNVQNI